MRSAIREETPILAIRSAGPIPSHSVLRGTRVRTRRAATLECVREVPKTMRPAAIEAFGGPGALLIHSLPVPVPAAGEVLIATNTAVGARIRRFSVGDAVYAAGFPNPLEGGGHQRWGWSSGFYAECDAVLALVAARRSRAASKRSGPAAGSRTPMVLAS